MTIALLGGPLDGAVTNGLSHLPLYMIAKNVAAQPVYKRISCNNCCCDGKAVPYTFIGYESHLDASPAYESNESN